MLNFEEFTFFFLVSGYRSVITGQKLFTLMIVRRTKFIKDTWGVFIVFPAILYSEIYPPTPAGVEFLILASTDLNSVKKRRR